VVYRFFAPIVAPLRGDSRREPGASRTVSTQDGVNADKARDTVNDSTLVRHGPEVTRDSDPSITWLTAGRLLTEAVL
jgi:hypothetical protein